MKRFRIFLSLLFCLAACTRGASAPEEILVVTTLAPVGEWVGEVGGSHVLVKTLVSNGADLHSYQPSAKDMAMIAECDLFVYVGGESENWVEDVFGTVRDMDKRNLCLLDVLGQDAKEEEIKEGMAAEEESGIDEHVWLSLRNAKRFVSRIEEELAKIDAAHADDYARNRRTYTEQLDELDGQYQEAVKGGTLVFADRFPFRYMFADYGLDYYAAFAGCSAESEASFSTVAFLADKIDELGLDEVMVIENSDQKLARTVINETGKKDQKILVLDSMQSAMDGTYLEIMAKNLEVLKEALQ